MGVVGRLLGTLACRQAAGPAAWQRAGMLHGSSGVTGNPTGWQAALSAAMAAAGWGPAAAGSRHFASQFSEVTDPALIRDFAIIGE